MSSIKWLFAGFVILQFNFACSSQPAVSVSYNQLGFYPEGRKIVTVSGTEGGNFALLNSKQDTVFVGTLSAEHSTSYAPKPVRLADFSSFTTPGTYQLRLPSVEEVVTLQIKSRALEGVAKGTLKGFYFQRMSTALPEKFAGKWQRSAGHPDDHVMVHGSAASNGRPAGTILTSSRGWYDAGDYNKYIVNSGITMGTLLSVFEDYPEYCKSVSMDIPEGTNSLPDILDEVLWNLRWMLTMQDPGDGGVYHKLTTAKFEGMVMPENAKAQRYVVAKSTAATLDFAAVMAQASRVFDGFKNDLPGLSDSCRAASVKALAWAQKNPAVLYSQRKINPEYDPDITTGEYGDGNVSDEFIWAACELFVTTGDMKYFNSEKIIPGDAIILPSWGQVATLGYYTLLRFKEKLPAAIKPVLEKIQTNILKEADRWVAGLPENPYHTAMGQSVRDYVWGSNAVAANQGILLMQAYRITSDKKYLFAAEDNADYLLGRNATGYSFVTGFGTKTPMHPHHRPSVADAVEEPVPGLLSGGPNPGMQDHCSGYPSKIPNEAFLDADCSYASNEIAINWNAPIVYLLWSLEATMSKH